MSTVTGVYKKVCRRIFGAEVETYGFNELIRLYCRYPRWLPLPFNVYHGWYIEEPRNSDLNHPSSLLLTFNKRQADEWKACSDKPVAVLGAPFIHYRRRMNLRRRDDARGTIVYPGHVATSFDGVFDQKKLCEELASLDKRYHPITVSVLEEDIRQDKDKIYRDYGFATFCPGPRRSVEFCRNFYEQLAKHRYSCGNHFGTNILYAVEMGVPFFFIGEMAVGRVRRTGEVVVKDRSPHQLELLARLRSLFAEPSEEVTSEQMRLVISESGIDDCLSPRELRRLLVRMLLIGETPNVLRRLAMWPVNSVRRRLAVKEV